MHYLFLLLLTISTLNASSLESLLEEYENSSKTSLETLDEKMGHVMIYTQKELQIMQYQKLSDVLRELPINNINTNKTGVNTISLAGSKTDISGFFRLFINDHEVSSLYIQSPSLGWIDMPISLIDHIEVYYGEGSFTLGNETGMQFIRVYTKSAKKENGNDLKISLSNKDSNSQEFTHSELLQNDWSYLVHGSNQNSYYKTQYNQNDIKNVTKQQYAFLSISNPSNNIDIGYTQLQKDKFMGYSTDLTPNDGDIDSKNFFINMNNYYLDDKSLKTTFSIDVNDLKYMEQNDQGLFVIPVLDLANMGTTMPKSFYQDLRFTKYNAYISKDLNYGRHKIFSALNFQNKRYLVRQRYATNFLNTTTDIDQFYDFDKENIYSLLLQDDYKITDNFHFITNYKLDKYERSGSTLKDETQYIYRLGTIYLPTQNFGIKTFYTKSYIPPSFYNIDFAAKSNVNLQTQQYKYYTLEGVYTKGNSKANLEYYTVRIDDFLYYSPVGYININDQVKTNGFIFDYSYTFANQDVLKFNYYNSRLNQTINNSAKGGYIKYMGQYKKIDYFSSLIYKNRYSYLDLTVPNSYNLNMGATYHYTKNISFGLQGNNLLNKPTKSLATDKSLGLSNQKNIAFSDYDRSVSLNIRWLF